MWPLTRKSLVEVFIGFQFECTAYKATLGIILLILFEFVPISFYTHLLHVDPTVLLKQDINDRITAVSYNGFVSYRQAFLT